VQTTNLAKMAYGGPAAATRTPRGIEYEVLARATQQLSSASGPDGAFPALARALHDNLRLWTVLASDVADDGNGLPAPLRARIFYLGEFTRFHTRKVLSGEASPGVLIDINTAVMRGLRGEVAAP
jgi:flagellar protein FlaF